MRKPTKNILLTFLLLSLFNCQEEKKENKPEVTIVKEEKIEKRNEVVINVNDTINSFLTNLFVDEIQEKPDMLYLGKAKNKTSVVIPTDNSIRIIGGDPFISYFYELRIEKGDSLLINLEKININQSKQIEYPIFNIPNSTRSWNELNFDYLLYKLNIKSKAIGIDPKNNFQKNIYASEKIYQNSIKLLDSLKANNLISKDFFTNSKINQKLKFATSKVREARYKKIELKDLNIKLNEETLLENNEYVSYLRALILYKYFKESKRVSYSNQFDFINDNETFLKGAAKQTLLDSYLKSIFFIEKPKFKKYLEKFNKVNLNEDFKNKWLRIVDIQKLNTDKLNKANRNVGTLTNLVNDNELTFEEILKKHKGKIVLVDFWASWCSPCRREMPFLKDLKSKFNETELKIIEISIDKDYSAWERASNLEKLSKEESNYIISNWEKSSLYKNYNIKSIPRYLLFGKEGKIIDEDAPRPSKSELADLIKASI